MGWWKEGLFDTTRNVYTPVGVGINRKQVNFRSLRAALRYAYRDLKDHPRSKPASHTIFFEYYYGSWELTYFVVHRVKEPKKPIQIICDIGNLFYYIKSDGTIGNLCPNKLIRWIR